MDLPSVIFICTGNLYRSPLAEFFFEKKLRGGNLDYDWCVKSAGTWTRSNLPADKNLQEVAEKYSFDVSQHRTTKIESVNLEKFDLIIVMEAGQKEAIVYEFPEIINRTYLLSEISGQPYDIRDPLGLDFAVLESVTKELNDLINKNFVKICELAQDNNERSA